MSGQRYYIMRRFYHYDGGASVLKWGEAWEIREATDAAMFLRQSYGPPCDIWLMPA